MPASTYQRNAWLSDLSPLYAVPVYGDPGSSGTSNHVPVAREEVTLGSPSNGSVSNSAEVAWSEFPSNYTVKGIAYFDASNDGNYRGWAPVASYNPVTDVGGDVVSEGQGYFARPGDLVFAID